LHRRNGRNSEDIKEIKESQDTQDIQETKDLEEPGEAEEGEEGGELEAAVERLDTQLSERIDNIISECTVCRDKDWDRPFFTLA
jgi:hypothetical protein